MKFLSVFAQALIVCGAFASPLAGAETRPASALGNQLLARAAFDFTNQKVRGVNLGGWLMLEPYMTPSLFDKASCTPIDEWTFSAQMTSEKGVDGVKAELEKHWQTFITRDDFVYLSEHGINLVRIPIGYWAYVLNAGDPYIQGQDKYLKQALEWAKEFNIKVWIDLHGVPGSQNGFDNSGRRGDVNWQQGDNVKITLEILKKIAVQYGSDEWSDVVAGIELVNEPFSFRLDMSKLIQFYKDGYETVRSVSKVPVIIHNAFRPHGEMNGNFSGNQFTDIILDHHHYEIFTNDEIKLDMAGHLRDICGYGNLLTKEDLPGVIGEWSAALTDCTKWLNGVGRGARYEGKWENYDYLGSCENNEDLSKWSDERKTNTRKFIEAQLDTYDRFAGWVFWNYKTESTIEWDFRRLIDAELFPYPFDERKYPKQCDSVAV